MELAGSICKSCGEEIAPDELSVRVFAHWTESAGDAGSNAPVLAYHWQCRDALVDEDEPNG